MANNSSTIRHPEQEEEIAATDGNWSAPVRLGLLENSGKLARSLIRAHTATASSLVTAVDILVFVGSTDAISPAAVAALNDERKRFLRTGIAVTGGTTTAEEDYNILGNTGGAPYDARYDPDDRKAEGALWLSIKPTGGDDTFTVLMAAADVK